MSKKKNEKRKFEFREIVILNPQIHSTYVLFCMFTSM